MADLNSPSAPRSDHSEHHRDYYHLATHLSTEENSHRHCTHQRSQQVGAGVPEGQAGAVAGAARALMSVSLLLPGLWDT